MICLILINRILIHLKKNPEISKYLKGIILNPTNFLYYLDVLNSTFEDLGRLRSAITLDD